ncbi:MAG: hypothetical protein C5B43_01540 [Verrucomicrobia bacterium]|nr:MAG: hypothetical protein C5B43_01540 [Verrucomicrobiota bacterium]
MLKKYPKTAFIILIGVSALFAITYCIGQTLESSISKDKANTKNPIVSCPESIEKGKALYGQYCKGCHGPDAVRAKNCPCTESFCPADLRNPKLWRMGEGAVFWTIRDGRKPMPCFGERFTEENTWHIVNYLHSLGQNTSETDSKK